jgi:hypothetical protein
MTKYLMIFRKIFSFPTVTLLVALTLSAIAAWYSILGLTAIFAAAVIPIIIMGGALEFAKVVTTLWLHKYWDRAGWNLKLYLIPAVIALAFLTSMGIFGFLSKAHSDQTLVSGDTSAKVELVDEKIKIARENIAMNQKALEQMNSQVDQLLGRTDDDKGANRAVQVRRQQRAERNRLQNEIGAEQEAIAKLNEEVAPIRAEIRKIEAEVGPIKYIAALIYGDNPDTNLLERAVRWVIILIVFVFDPLALMLVLAAQSSYKWLDDDLRNRRKEKEDEEEVDKLLDEALADMLHETAYDDPKEDENVSEPIQPNDIPTDDVVREDVLDAPTPDAVPSGSSVVQSETRNEVTTDIRENKDESTTELPHDDVAELNNGVGELLQSEPLPDDLEPIEESVQQVEPVKEVIIQTEGVTYPETDGGYVQYHDKSMSKTVFLELHPELVAKPNQDSDGNASFGTQFPKFAQKGNIFVRVDMLPNRVYKFGGDKWIEINKEQTDVYLYNEEYVRHLISKIETGEYDLELLSDKEKAQIEDYLKKTSGL